MRGWRDKLPHTQALVKGKNHNFCTGSYAGIHTAISYILYITQLIFAGMLLLFAIYLLMFYTM